MIVFDTLDKLENYASIIPHMDKIIATMDHAKPYEDDRGVYDLGDGVEYVVSVHLSSSEGFLGENWPGRMVMEITLEGDEIVSIDDSVFRLPEGRFLLYPGESKIKRGISSSLPVAFKSVRFIL